jgi:glycolate oxidase FAD binding subunit
VRDYVLGTRLLTGDGRVLRFGGEVMKNVAGYDVSRLVVGSLGILGVVLDVSLKVLPRPPGACTLRYQYDAEEAVRWLASVVQRGIPVAASFWHTGELRVRLEASLQGLHALARELGGERMEEHAASEGWSAVREQRLSCFRSAATLWRLHVPAPVSMPRGSLRERLSFEWNGAQRWMACDDEGAVRIYAGETGGSLTRFRSAGRLEPGVEVFDAVPDPVMRLHREVKRAFDPAGILNPGRLYWGL